MLVQGYERDNLDFNYINTKILINNQNFIHQSKRCSTYVSPPIPPSPSYNKLDACPLAEI